MTKTKYIFSLLVSILLCLSSQAGIHHYAEQSILNDGNWVKIRVGATGVCRMSFSELSQAGLNPQQLRVFGFGGAQLEQDFTKAKIDDLPQVPVYIGDGYVLFWVHGPYSWQYNGTRFAHTRNTYSNYGYYFLTDNTGEMMVMPYAEEISGTPTDVYTYMNYQVHESDSINLVDKEGKSGGGKHFYGETFSANEQMVFSFNTPNAIEGETSNVYIDVAAYSSYISVFAATINNSTKQNVSIAPYGTDHFVRANVGVLNMRGAVAAQKQEVALTLQSSSINTTGWLNYIEITTPCSLQMYGSWLPIRSTVNYKSSTPVRFHLQGANEHTQIWDVTNKAAIQRIPTTMQGEEMVWVGSQQQGIREYVAVNTQENNQWIAAEVVGKVKNQNLHALRNIDYVIICPDGYQSIAEQLAKAHQEKEGITWAVVTEEEVFNEFSSGTPDATAYRWLMKMLYDRADSNNAKPRWLLLMGHGTFDNRKLLGERSGSRLLLSYQSNNSINEVQAYGTDDYFGFLDDNEGASDTQGRMDIGVGRLPINNTTEAQEVVDKLIRYIRNEQPGKWKNQIIFLADDGDGGSHTETAEGGAERVRINNPDFVVNKIYLDAYPQETNASGESYPLAKNKLTNLLKSGALFFDYSGHGGYNAITSESILNMKDIENMTNKNLAFWFFASCNFGQWDSGQRCAAETAVLNPNGGAVGVLAATRTTYAQQNTNLNRSVCDTLFGHKNVFHYEMTLGEAIAIGKNQLGDDSNKLPYCLLGDPAMRLNYPTQYQVQTTTEMDTINALSVQTVEGQIIDEDAQVVADFNGKVDITVYDKLQVITTRDNDNKTDEATEIPYNDYPNKLFSGSAEVQDGLFQYTFMVPKDIRYNYGNGRIVYYAYTTDSLELAEAVGHFEEFIIGGTGNILSADTLGPQMHIYLNTPTFRSGDKTYATPRFFADIHDENGINTAGAGIGHDLMLIVDDDPKQIYTLNEYFTAANSSYQDGQVSYLMEELPDGPHTLTFRAWDLLNNSTTQTLNFIVEEGLDPSISSVTTYPNPVQETGIMNIAITYDQPDELLHTEIYIYNINGQLVWSHMQDNPTQVQLNIPAIGLQSGVYIYSIKTKSATSKYSITSGKIIVTK